MTQQATAVALGEALPEMIAAALESYRDFARQQVPEEAKAFAQHHTACKAALAHIELLLKLARGLPQNEKENSLDLTALLAEAAEALAADAQAEDEGGSGTPS